MHDVRVQLVLEPLVRVELAAAVELVLQVAEHLLGRRVVQAVALAAHGLTDAEASELFPPPPVLVLPSHVRVVLLQCLFDRFGSVFPQCGLMVFPGVVIVSRCLSHHRETMTLFVHFI